MQFKNTLFIVIVLGLIVLTTSIASAGTKDIDHQQLDSILRESWNAYKQKFLSTDGRVIDPTAQNITTSEGQSYALLRAAWLDDKEVFEKVLGWTRSNLLASPGDLFAWKWGERADHTWGVLDQHSATDADQDIALALIIAGNRWHNDTFIEQAKIIIGKIWNKDILKICGKPYVTAGDWVNLDSKSKINPSYFAPYSYRIFAKLDSQHDWTSVIDSSYDTIEQSCRLNRLGLPPDWCDIDTQTGKAIIDLSSHKSDYSYDAMRVPWRLALDWQWNKEPRAKALLDEMCFLQDSWQATRTIRGAYSSLGVTRDFDEPLAGFGCVLPGFQITSPDIAQQVLQERLMSTYNNGLWPPKNNYYGQNWVWFGIAAFNGELAPPAF